MPASDDGYRILTRRLPQSLTGIGSHTSCHTRPRSTVISTSTAGLIWCLRNSFTKPEKTLHLKEPSIIGPVNLSLTLGSKFLHRLREVLPHRRTAHQDSNPRQCQLINSSVRMGRRVRAIFTIVGFQSKNPTSPLDDNVFMFERCFIISLLIVSLWSNCWPRRRGVDEYFLLNSVWTPCDEKKQL